VLALRGFERVAIKRPGRIGDTIRVEGELESKKELDAVSGLVVFSFFSEMAFRAPMLLHEYTPFHPRDWPRRPHRLP
ncbi:MAG TPA: hypothetical protein PLP61_12840, partial [Nocardioides sp.]|uniref:hypothetical protein n=1 Tax=Nocardioides sp. TaxID=35761 RepID=UPI002D184E79